MSIRGLHALVGRAVVSEDFRKGVLNGRRAEFVRQADLEPDEAALVLDIQADSLESFAAAMNEIISARQRPALRPWPAPRSAAQERARLLAPAIPI